MKIKFIATLFIFSFFQHIYAQDLVETYRLAQKNDPQLKRSYLTQFSVAESKSQSIAQMLPNIAVSGQGSRERISNKRARDFIDNPEGIVQNRGINNYWDSGFAINFSQPVFHWDHWVQLSQSDNRIAQTEAQYQAEQQNLMVRTTEAYFNVLAAQDNLEFTLAEKKAIGRQLEQAQQRFDVGLIAITDVYEAQAGYDKSLADQIEAQNELDDNKEALREIIGENKVSLATLTKKIDFSLPVPNDIAKWSKNAETNNFNIIAALNEAEIKRKDISIQKSGHLPTLDIVANYGVQDASSTQGFRGDRQSYGLELNIPIFQGGLISSRARQAAFDFQAAKEDLLIAKRKATLEVRVAFRDVFSNIARVRALKATVASSKSALEATEAGFEVGTRTMVDVLDGQRDLYKSKQDYSKSRYDYLVSGVKLKQAASNLTEQDLDSINRYLGN